MAKLLMLFVDGVEDTEAIATLDVLSRGGHQVVCSSLMKRREINTKLGKILVVDSLIENETYANYDGVVIPGGPGSFKIMAFHPEINAIINYFAQNNKLVASICAAPFMVGRLGYFKDRNYTVHPGFEEQVIGGNYLKEQGVVRDGNFITAKSMYYSIPFGLAIDTYFNGDEHSKHLEESCKGNK